MYFVPKLHLVLINVIKGVVNYTSNPLNMKISLKQKKLKSNKISLYLEYYKGSYKDENV